VCSPPVDAFPEEIGVPVVPGVLGQHVLHDAAQGDWLAGREPDADVVERDRREKSWFGSSSE
jgi:hypothetical protein